MKPSGDLWIIASAEKVQEVAGWLDKSVRDPRYIIHESGCAIAVGALCEDDRLLFGMMYPELSKTLVPHSVMGTIGTHCSEAMLRRFAKDHADGRELACELTKYGVQVTSQCPRGGKPKIMTTFS